MNDFETVTYRDVEILLEDSCKREKIYVFDYDPLPTFIFYLQ